MKLKQIIAVLVALITLASCSESGTSKVEIIAKENGELIYYKDFKNYLNQKFDTVKLEKDKPTTITFDSKLDMGVLADPKSNSQIVFYIKNGKSESITINSFTPKEDGLDFTFNGENKEINSYLKNRNVEAKIFAQLQPTDSTKVVTIDQVANQIVESRKKGLAKVSDADFKVLEEGNIKYIPKLLPIIFYARTTAPEMYDSIKELSAVLKEKVVEEPKYTNSDIYLAYLNTRFQIDFQKKKNPAAQPKLVDFLTELQKTYKDKGLTSKLLDLNLMQYISSPMVQTEDKEIETFIKEKYTGNNKEAYLAKLGERSKAKAAVPPAPKIPATPPASTEKKK